MNSRQKIKDAYEKLRCFDNPLLHDIADNLEQSYRDMFGEGIKEIIYDVALKQNVNYKDIVSDSRDEHLVYCRYLIAKRSKDDYFLKEIANALNRKHHTSIIHLLNDYQPPAKFTS